MWQEGDKNEFFIFDDVNNYVGRMVLETIPEDEENNEHQQWTLYASKQARKKRTERGGGLRAKEEYAYYAFSTRKQQKCLFYEGKPWNGDKVTITDCIWDHSMKDPTITGLIFIHKKSKVEKVRYFISKTDFEREATKMVRGKQKAKTKYCEHNNRWCNDQQYVVRLNKFEVLK